MKKNTVWDLWLYLPRLPAVCNTTTNQLSYGVIKQFKKNLDYLHFNPVESGEVEEPQHYPYSSAIGYASGKGMLEITLMV